MELLPHSIAPVISGDNNQVLVIGAAERDELVKLRQEALEAMQPRNLASNEARLTDSSNHETGHLADLAVASEPARRAGSVRAGELGGFFERLMAD